MRILISANAPNWDAIVVPSFEAAPYWLLVDPDSNLLEAIHGENRPLISSLQVAAVITGHVQADTAVLAAQAGILIYSIPAGGIRIACEQWKRGRLKPAIVQESGMSS